MRIDKEYLLKLRTKEFAFECLSLVLGGSGCVGLECLTSAAECKRLFGAAYPILIQVPDSGPVDDSFFFGSDGSRHYYPNLLEHDGHRYIVSSGWPSGKTRGPRVRFADWVLHYFSPPDDTDGLTD